MMEKQISKNIQRSNLLLIIVSILLTISVLPVQAETPKYKINKDKKFGYIRVKKSEAPQPKETSEDKKAPTSNTTTKENTVNQQKTKKKSLPPPWRLDAGLRIAEIEIVSGKYTQAIETLKKVLERHPGNTDAYTYTGYSYMKLGMLDKAEENLGYALKMSPDHMGAHLYMGLLSLEKNKPQLAMESLQAIRIVCRGMICSEENYLANKIDSHKAKKKNKNTK